eukprot:12332227-Karenia_brevis.AAC.1
MLVGLQTLACLVHRLDEAQCRDLNTSEGFFDRNDAGRTCLSALPDEYQRRSVVDGNTPDLFESLSAIGVTPFVFD